MIFHSMRRIWSSAGEVVRHFPGSSTISKRSLTIQTDKAKWILLRSNLQGLQCLNYPSLLTHSAKVRTMSTQTPQQTIQEKNANTAKVLVATAIAMLGLSYASVPLYRMFCQVTGFGGTVQDLPVKSVFLTPTMDTAIRPESRIFTIQFNSDVSADLPWSFKPDQYQTKVLPGETTLAFYTAHNWTDHGITGVATYNVTPAKAGIYFNKIQCFCFEEQRLKPRESIEMPVFFFVDPEIVDDPRMADVDQITLSYTFFKTSEDYDEEDEEGEEQQDRGLGKGKENAVMDASD